MVFPWLNGWLFRHGAYVYIMYVLIIIGAIMCVQLVVMQTVASHHGDRFQQGGKTTELTRLTLYEKCTRFFVSRTGKTWQKYCFYLILIVILFSCYWTVV
jgi:hypothetical protein